MDSWVHRTDWLALRTMARCENAILPIWDIPGLPQRTGGNMVETEESSASLGYAPTYSKIPVYRMESMAGTEHAEGCRGLWEPRTF